MKARFFVRSLVGAATLATLLGSIHSIALGGPAVRQDGISFIRVKLKNGKSGGATDHYSIVSDADFTYSFSGKCPKRGATKRYISKYWISGGSKGKQHFFPSQPMNSDSWTNRAYTYDDVWSDTEILRACYNNPEKTGIRSVQLPAKNIHMAAVCMQRNGRHQKTVQGVASFRQYVECNYMAKSGPVKPDRVEWSGMAYSCPEGYYVDHVHNTKQYGHWYHPSANAKNLKCKLKTTKNYKAKQRRLTGKVTCPRGYKVKFDWCGSNETCSVATFQYKKDGAFGKYKKPFKYRNFEKGDKVCVPK